MSFSSPDSSRVKKKFCRNVENQSIRHMNLFDVGRRFFVNIHHYWYSSRFLNIYFLMMMKHVFFLVISSKTEWIGHILFVLNSVFFSFHLIFLNTHTNQTKQDKISAGKYLFCIKRSSSSIQDNFTNVNCKKKIVQSNHSVDGKKIVEMKWNEIIFLSIPESNEEYALLLSNSKYIFIFCK